MSGDLAGQTVETVCKNAISERVLCGGVRDPNFYDEEVIWKDLLLWVW